MKINSIYSYKSIISFLTGVSLLLGASSCSDMAEFDDPGESAGESSVLTFRCSDMLEVYKGENNYASRAGGPKNPAEKEIKTLHVFFFSMETGKLLTSSNYQNFPAYQRLVNDAAFLKIPTGDGVEDLFEEGNSGIRIVAIANIHATDEADDATDANNMFKTSYSIEGKIQQDGREIGGAPYEITCYDDLKKWVYHPRIRMKDNEESDDNNISRLPSSGMSMIGEVTDVDLNKKEAFVVNLRALMAKVNVSVKLEPKQYTATYPRLTITEYGVKNMPIAVPFVACTGEPKEGKSRQKTTTYEEYIETYDVTTASMYHNSGADEPAGSHPGSCNPADHEYTTTAGLPVTIDKDSPVQTFSYYMYENIQLPNYGAVRTDGTTPAFNDNLEPIYPDGVEPENYQRWKSTMAYTDRASALILKGEYITDQGLRYNAQFTVYMGSDSETDFQVKRNHRYDNNIVIHGLDYIRNSDDNAYTFDGRVNVHDDNPFYLAIINERKVDAHATALPMDVWFMLRENGDGTVVENPDWNSEITFTVRDHEKVNWIRMEKVPRWDRDEKTGMENGGFKAGHGARNYFTTNLVTEELADNWTMTVRGGGESDANADGSRSRIYFYIDENVPESNTPINYGDRMAIIDVEYKRTEEDGTVERRTRTLEIEQRALVKVSGAWTGNDGATDNIPETWMEYYEEYLEHSDPLDQHEMPGELYSGLPWGLSGVNVGNIINGFRNPESGHNATQIYYKTGAFAMTQWDINRSDTQGVENLYLFSSDAPQSAFQYCYGKNKRNDNGTAAVSGNKGWYMPGIRELEKALVDYYEDFVDFRGNLYWSASGTSSNTNARATKVTINGARITYAQSGNNGDEGYNPRTQANRIRAFYRVD